MHVAGCTLAAMRALVCLLIACSSGAKPQAPSNVAAAPITGGAVKLTTWSVSHVDSLFFTDGGQRLVGAGYGSIIEIDPVTRKQVGMVSLSSATVPNPKGRPGVGETLNWEVRESIWAWDKGSILGVAQLSGWGAVLTGLAVWRPASGAPIGITAPPGYMCEPLVISSDRKAFVTRVDTSKRGCGPTQTGAQVYSIDTQKPLSPPLDLGFTRRAAFSRDGRYAAAGGKTGLQVVDLRAEKVVASLPLAQELTSLAFHPTTNTLAWTDDERELWSWKIGDPAPVKHGAGTGFAFSPDGRFAAVNRVNKLELLDATTLTAIGAPLEGVAGVFTDAIAFSDDGTQLAVAISGTEIGVWQLAPRTAKPFEDGWLKQLRPLPTPAAKPFPKIEHDGRLEGRVLIGDKPVANAEVTISAHHQEYDDARALPPLTTRTKADGSYLFENAPTIIYQQLVRAPGATIGGYVFDMREKKSHKADVKLDPAVTIRGQVLGPDNKPARSVRIVHIRGYGDQQVDIVTDAKGRFVIDHLRPATKYPVTARRADGAVRSKLLDISKPGPLAATLKLAAPTDPSVVQIVVVDKTGAPAANARVSSDSNETLTDASGKASLDIDGKQLRLRANGEDGSAISDSIDLQMPQPAPIKIVLTN